MANRYSSVNPRLIDAISGQDFAKSARLFNEKADSRSYLHNVLNYSLNIVFKCIKSWAIWFSIANPAFASSPFLI
jgi:hypothetical protein